MNKSLQLLSRVSRWAGGIVLALGALHAQAGIQGILGGGTDPRVVGAAGARTFNLIATDGYINAADGVQIYMWGFGETSKGAMQYTAPTLLVKQGDTVTVSMKNLLPTRTSILFPGQSGVVGTGGTAGVLAHEAAPQQTVTYTFTATQPGTYLYQSGTQPGLQVEMGMIGALIVYPTTAGTAYNHAGTAYRRETLFVSTEADANLHTAVAEQVQTFRAANPGNPAAETVFTADLAHRFPSYWFLNGRTAPDTLAANNVGELPLQPYNCLPRVNPAEKLLMRMVGGGSDLHPMHHHGNNSWAIARDGRMLTSNAANAALGPNLGVSDFTIAVVPGQTYDALWSWTGAGLGWDIYGKICGGVGQPTCASVYPPGSPLHQLASDRGKPIPVTLPSQLELAFGEFYSGSPYLGDFGNRPIGAGIANTTASFFHMIHSHNEREIVNGGVFPGGMMTMIVIEPNLIFVD